MRFKIVLLSIFYALLSQCGDSSKSESTDSPAQGADAGLIPTGQIAITGELKNGDNAENIAALKEQKVEIIRNDGVVVGEGTTTESGSFSVDMAAGSLVVGTAYSLLADTEANATTEEFSYNLEVKIPDDGNGKALGIRKKIDISVANVEEDTIALGSQTVKEISAIVGSVKFANTTVGVSSVDVFIPGKPYFLRTGDDGKFNLLFVPAGKYSIRFTKGIYIKDVDVEVTAGKTLALGEVELDESNRDPLPLSTVLIGKWKSTCYYVDNVESISPEAPREGVLDIKSLTDIIVTGDSCLLRSFAAPAEVFEKLHVLGDGAIYIKFDTPSYYLHQILEYSTNRIVIYVDSTSLGGKPTIEVLEKIP